MPSISPPLPLPIQFTLLASLSPTKTLVPLLYSEVNGLPIYVTLSPAHPPHVSLLPLLLALFPASPLHIIKLFPPGRISLNLDGNAPFVDLWAPLPLARELCDQLGVLHLFHRCGRKDTGLLSEQVEQMISWEEDGCICHNWLPSSEAITASTYCLDTLLSSSFRHINIIPDERYITTRMDRDRRAKLVSLSEYDDPSRIRSGGWGEAWSECLKWTMAAWEEYSLYPFRPHTYDTKDDLARTVHQLLPRLASLATPSHRLSYPLAQADIASLLDTPVIAEPPISDLIRQLLLRLIRSLPWLRSHRSRHSSLNEQRVRERKARIQLGVVELVGVGLINAFQRDRDKKPSLQEVLWRGKSQMEKDDTELCDVDVREEDREMAERESEITRHTDHTDMVSADTYRDTVSTRETRKTPEEQTWEGPNEGTSTILESENKEGWWMYLSIAGTIALAYLLSFMQV